MVIVGDPIADFIIRLKNASMAKHEQVEVPHSKIKEQIASTLERCGYVKDVSVKGDGTTKRICITVPYDEKRGCAIKGVRRLSKPSRRVYISSKHIYPYKNGRGAAVLSTPAGIMIDSDAKKKKVGGEVLFYIW